VGDELMEESKLYELAVKHWGEKAQLLKTIEELGEFSRAIARYLIEIGDDNAPKTDAHSNIDLMLHEMYWEIVDVEVMIAQLKHNFQRPKMYEHLKEIILARLKRYLEREGEVFIE
jgi:hypothetical protein